MCTDGDGINSYFHCLIYWEKFTLYDIKNDFDELATNCSSRKKNTKKRNNSIISQSLNSNLWKNKSTEDKPRVEV